MRLRQQRLVSFLDAYICDVIIRKIAVSIFKRNFNFVKTVLNVLKLQVCCISRDIKSCNRTPISFASVVRQEVNHKLKQFPINIMTDNAPIIAFCNSLLLLLPRKHVIIDSCSVDLGSSVPPHFRFLSHSSPSSSCYS